jgi:hypothetical protein
MKDTAHNTRRPGMKKVELKLDVVRVAPDAEVGRWEEGHFQGRGLIFLIAGSNNSPGWGIGGWDETGEGRLVTGGPKVRGPHAYFVALCGVIDNYGGTGAVLQEGSG